MDPRIDTTAESPLLSPKTGEATVKQPLVGKSFSGTVRIVQRTCGVVADKTAGIFTAAQQISRGFWETLGDVSMATRRDPLAEFSQAKHFPDLVSDPMNRQLPYFQDYTVPESGVLPDDWHRCWRPYYELD